VASNVAPKAVADMVHAALKGDWKTARELHQKYYRLFTDLFVDTNPIPVKAAMAMMGLCEEVYRLPLCETSEANKAKVRDCLKQLKLV
jgi:4-hydroxy-tetrahydrodipicolinate synthase